MAAIYCAYLQTRWQQALKRIADGFVHRDRQTSNQERQRTMRRKAVVMSWQKS